MNKEKEVVNIGCTEYSPIAINPCMAKNKPLDELVVDSLEINIWLLLLKDAKMPI